MNRTFQKIAPIILSILGSSGVVATAILAVKATPKAQKRIKEIKEKESEVIDDKIYNKERSALNADSIENKKQLDLSFLD